MYVYRANKFNEELKKYHSLSARVDNLCLKLEAITLSQAQEKFCWIHSYLKRKEGNFRLIAKLIKLEKETVLCFLKIYRRGEPNYRHFLENVKHQNNLFEESNLSPALNLWVTEYKNKAPKTIDAILEDELRVWLERPNWNMSHGITIHESELWSHNFSQPKIRHQATVYRQIIEELIVNISENKPIGTETNWSNIRFYGKDKFYILYSDIKLKDKYQEQVLLLITPVFGVPQNQEIYQIIEPLVGSNGNTVTNENRDFASSINSIYPNWWQKRHSLALDDLITYTKRSYPWYLISDEKFWLRIQDGDGVNLALSTEEKELLHSVSTKESLPLFLNGRAGSGKSTMLFYLFAYYCYRHLQLCKNKQQNFFSKPHPLFLTYSPSLSDFAKVKVQSILKHHYHFLEETTTLDKVPHLSSFFKSFRCFLLKLLPASERANFAEENYVSFHRFRELLASRWQNVSSERCWLVIQNFIKGYELIQKDLYLESTSKYQQIPKKERTVTIAEFEQVRDTVWLWYRKYTQEHNLWDDRDLVRTILDLHCYKPEYTVIFCDEAQDFTRLELQLIVGLSIFSLYNLEQENVVSLPFAFAGDPLQTLNPTGFRWSSFKAAFHDEILAPLGLKSQSPIELKLRQLEYNYRSAAAIVKANNLIQLWRKILFGFSSIEPQKAKKYSEFVPQKFILGNNISLEDLQDTIKDSIILIPCDEGAEQEFIAQDNLLSALYSEINTENSWNILSAISAKGLEFKQVILYRFGEFCTLELGENEPVTTEEDKYFLNKLYVAASRATEKLFIVDSLEGEIKLWSFASDRTCLNHFLEQIDNQLVKQKWQQNIELITLGTSLSEFNNNVEADALTFETVGINTENSNLLARAIAAYRQSQNQAKVDFCLAWKLKLERNYVSAGELFLQQNKLVEAWGCFWQAKSWHQLQQLIIRIQNVPTPETSHFLSLSLIVDFMVKDAIAQEHNSANLAVTDFIKLTDFLAAEIQHNNLVEERDTATWQVFLDAYCSQIQQLLDHPLIIQQQQWQKIAQVLTNYLEDSSTTVKQLIAQCWYLGHSYHQAIQYWEDIDDLTAVTSAELKNYYIAKAKIAQLPKGLQYLYKGQQYHLIIKLWLKAGAKSDKAWLQYVGYAFEAVEQYQNALAIYCQLNDFTKVQQCWSKIKNNSPTFTQFKQLLRYYLQHQYWDEAIKVVQLESASIKVKCYFVHSLAQSKLTSNTLNKIQRQNYQKFVEQNILNSSTWQQYLTVEYTGIALEKIGSFSVTLAFYEQYVNSANSLIQQFSRDRWIYIKQKQVEYFRSKVKLAKVQKTQQQLTSNAKKWQINPDSVSAKSLADYISKAKLSHYATVKGNNQNLRLLKQSSFANAFKPSFTVIGLPQNSRLKRLAPGIQQIQLYHLLIRLAESSQQLVIFDILNNKAVHIDWLKGKVQIETTTITISPQQPLSLSDTKGQYQATLWRNANPRLELKLDSYPKIITIKFNTL